MKNLLKNFVGFLCVCALSVASYAANSAEWKIKNIKFQERNDSPDYFIQVDYPEIARKAGYPRDQEINKMILKPLSSIIDGFKSTLKPDSPDLRDFPVSMQKNSLNITYASHLVKLPNRTIASFRFQVAKKLSGAGAPSHHFFTLNYDLTHGKVLSFESLFKPDSDYLKLLSHYCQDKLTKRLTSNMQWLPWNLDSIGPAPENFKVWNLQKNGLLITFEESQVSPYSDTSQSVLVPYSVLTSVAADPSPIVG